MGPCPFNGNCLAESLIYRAEVIDENSNLATYTGLTGNSFKKRHYRHKQSFKHRKLEHDTTLSSYIWSLKDANINFDIQWREVGTAPRFNPITRKCNSYIKDKYHIIFQPEVASLYKRHKLRDLLGNILSVFFSLV